MTDTTWTEEELDAAIAAQPEGPAFSAEAKERALARVLAAVAEEGAEERGLVAAGEVPQRGGRRGSGAVGRRWLVAAAAVTLVAGALVAAPTLWSSDSGPAASAAETLRQAAAATTAQPGPSTGQYRYIATHSWDLGGANTRTGKPLSVLFHNLQEKWIPADRTGEWLERRAVLDHRWVVGSEELAKAEGDGGLFASSKAMEEMRGLCGDYPGWNEPLGGDPDWGKPCLERVGSWYTPNPRFLGALPTEPQALYDRLWNESHQNGASALYNAGIVLASPDASKELRSALYQALQHLPNLQVTERAANLNGRVGTALGVPGGATREDIIIDPESGRYIGMRMVLTEPGTDSWAGVPAGTDVSFTAVDTGVVDRAGDRP
ncbi:CU044_5270 family protein [Lentzea sp. JNUCC 0626]|uniref:CU044_5270 family protein n=1 Tax=Lentzea sp. JNUCC 0626 TaxID=3367513 RepID=UPI003749A9A4